MSLVSIASVSSPSKIDAAVQRATELLGFQSGSGVRTAVIKPDMCYFWDYSTGQTTDPRFVAGLVDYLREHVSSDVEIVVVESDSVSRKCSDVFKFLGYTRLARRKGVKLVNLSQETADEFHVQVGNRAFSFRVPNLVRKADLFINVAKIKRSPVTKIACSVQNLYGCNPDSSKLGQGFQTDEVTVAFGKLVKPHLCLADGLIVHGKHTTNLGCLLASIDPVAIDTVAARILGLDAQKINHINIACMERMGSMKYNIAGEDVEGYVARFPKEDASDKMWNVFSSFGLLAFKKLGKRTDLYS